MQITVMVKSVFGNDTVYPVDDTAKTFTKLTGRKTFTPSDLVWIRELGYEIKLQESAPVRPEWIYGK